MFLNLDFDLDNKEERGQVESSRVGRRYFIEDGRKVIIGSSKTILQTIQPMMWWNSSDTSK